MTRKSELAWKLDDYLNFEVEPSARIIADPTACEGELMTPEEVRGHIKDSIGTLLIMLDAGSSRFNEVRDNFLADLDFLFKLGKLGEDEYNEIRSSEELNL